MSESKSGKKKVLLRTSQFITWPIAYVFFNSLYNIRVLGQENLEKANNPFIIIANHFTSVDCFLFRLILGFSTPHLPLRFMAVDKFDYKELNFFSNIGVIPFIYKMFGVIIVTPGLGIQKNLEEAKQIITQGENVVIYPEGGIVKGCTIAPFRTGAAVLASETGAAVLPISFRLGDRKFFRKDLIINIGEQIHVLHDAHPDETTKMFSDAITDLYEKNKS